jgi:F0F1-type ATP synthase delta subunit
MELKLPNTIGGKRDLILATRQVEQVLNDRLQDEVRERFGAQKIGTKAGQKMLQELLDINRLKDDTQTLKNLLQQLEGFRQYAPQVRIAFSQEPDQDMYQKIVGWFRAQIHPSVLVQVGVQPTIGGGFILHTPVRRYDMTLKTKILASTPKFLEILKRVG